MKKNSTQYKLTTLSGTTKPVGFVSELFDASRSAGNTLWEGGKDVTSAIVPDPIEDATYPVIEATVEKPAHAVLEVAEAGIDYIDNRIKQAVKKYVTDFYAEAKQRGAGWVVAQSPRIMASVPIDFPDLSYYSPEIASTAIGTLLVMIAAAAELNQVDEKIDEYERSTFVETPSMDQYDLRQQQLWAAQRAQAEAAGRAAQSAALEASQNQDSWYAKQLAERFAAAPETQRVHLLEDDRDRQFMIRAKAGIDEGKPQFFPLQPYVKYLGYYFSGEQPGSQKGGTAPLILGGLAVAALAMGAF